MPLTRTRATGMSYGRGEITEPLAGRSLAAARHAAAQRLVPLRAALEAVLAKA